MLTEIWFKTKDKAVRLPVIPSEFERVIDANYDTERVMKLGDIAIFNGNGLAQLSFSSFFPNHDYSFNAYSDIPKPYDIAHIFKEWKNKGTVVRVILTGTDINQEMYITNFAYGERDGTGDVYYTMDLLEYRPIIVPTITENNSNNTQNTNRPTDTNNKNNSSGIIDGKEYAFRENIFYGDVEDLYFLSKEEGFDELLRLSNEIIEKQHMHR